MSIRDLFSHAWQSSSAQKRLAAVRSIADERLLERIAQRGSHADVRLTAVLRLSNEEALIRVIERSHDEDVLAAALSRISNEGRARVVGMTQLPAGLRRSAFEAITLPSTMVRVIDHLIAFLYRSPSPAKLERLIAIGWTPRNDDERALVAMAWGDWSWLVELGRRSPVSVRRLISWDDSLRDHVAGRCLRLLSQDPQRPVEEDARTLARAAGEYEEERWRSVIFQREQRTPEWKLAAAGATRRHARIGRRGSWNPERVRM